MPADEITRRTREELPGKILAFLRGLAVCPPARAALEAAGYKAEVSKRVWELMHKICG